MLNTRLPRRAVLALTAPAALSACGLTAARFTADPPPEGVEAFRAGLFARGVNVTVRDTRGTSIDAACGQLAAGAATLPAPTRRPPRG